MGASSASPPPPMERLRGIFLRRLEVDFLKLRPRFVAAVRDADERATTPEERARLSDEAVEQFGGDPIQPWNRLLTALEDIEMKLDAVRFSVEMTRRSEDGRLMTFVEYHRPVLLKAAAEALEHFVNQLRANRIVRAEFVEMQIRRVRDSLLRDDVLNARRNEVAHTEFAARGNRFSGPSSVLVTGRQRRRWAFRTRSLEST